MGFSLTRWDLGWGRPPTDEQVAASKSLVSSPRSSRPHWSANCLWNRWTPGGFY